MTSSRALRLLPAAFALLLAVSVWPLSRRHQAETRNRAVEISAEIETIEALGAGQGIDLPTSLKMMKEKGLSAVVVNEESIGELISVGKLQIEASSVLGEKGGPRVPFVSLRVNDPAVLVRVQNGLLRRFGNLMRNIQPRADSLALPPLAVTLVRQTPVGLDPDQVQAAKTAGLRLIARAGNPSGASAHYVRATLTALHEDGAEVFLPQGDQVLGRRDALKTTENTMAQLGMLYASPEFAKISGDESMVTDAPERVIRLHTAQSAELDKLNEDGAVDRFVRAARERNMRILLLRPISQSADGPLDAFGEFVEKVSQGVVNMGLELAKPHAYTDPAPPRVYNLVLGAAAAFLGWATLAALTANRRLLTAGGIFMALGALAAYSKTGLSAMALIAAIAAPIAGFLMADAMPDLGAKGPRALRPLPAFALISLASILGGLFVAATMTGLPFLVKAVEFRGIKMAVFAPIFFIGCLYLYRLTDVRATRKSAITWGAALTGVILVAGLAVLNARTGNDGGVGASDTELIFRGVLDKILFIRPRTKEFLIGHPALWVALGLLLTRRQKINGGWIALLIAMGAVGQTGLLNTFCHGHIPFLLSFARTLIGLVMGSLLGIVAWAIVDRFLPEPRPNDLPSTVSEQTLPLHPM
ncbi:DUF5693 family protein [soil metagenome]